MKERRETMIANISRSLGITLLLLLTVVSATLIYVFNPASMVEAGKIPFMGSSSTQPAGTYGRIGAAPFATTVTGASVVQTPNTPGAPAKYEINFNTPSVLANGVDTIIITFDNEIGVPLVLDRNNISIALR